MASRAWRRTGAGSCCFVAAFAAAGALGCGDIGIPLLLTLSSATAADASSYAPTDGPSDASLDPLDLGDAGAGEAAVAADAQDSAAAGAFGAVALVAALSDPNADDEDPTFTADELELYFMSDRAGSQDIWVSKRAAKTDPWGAPTRVAELSGAMSDQGPSVALDGLTLWFSSDRDAEAGTGYDLWVSSRATRQDTWAAPRRIAELSSPAVDAAPAIDEAELVLVFMSDRAGGVGGMDLYMSSRPTRSDPWGSPVNLIDVNTPGDEWDPFLGDQDRQLFWAANRPHEEIRWAMRGSVTQRFSPYQALLTLGVPDYDPTLSVDLRHILFGSSRSGNQEIYEAFR